jgi:hypothetical protein
MVIVGMPSLAITIEPLFSNTQDVTSLAVTVRCEGCSVQANQPFLTLRKMVGNVPAPNYSEDANPIRASDDEGELQLRANKDVDALFHSWSVQRTTQGPIVFSFVAPPRQITSSTRPGPRIDLRLEHGGISGTLGYFLPRPVSLPDEQQWKTTLSWDLEKAPKGTRAMWTFGDASSTRARLSTIDDFCNTYLAVGPLQGTPSAVDDDAYGTYWFGDLPPALLGFESKSKDLFQKLSALYQDPMSSTNPYRIFIRKVDPQASFGGSAYLRSYILEWSTTRIQAETPLSIFMLISHEMIHNWAVLKSANDGPGANDERLMAWYDEGVAEFHGITLPWRFKLITTQDMIKHLNLSMQAYYTSPAINMSNSEAVEHEWGNSSAQRLLYDRGCVFSILMDIKIRQATAGQKSLDDVIIPLSLQRVRGERHDESEYRRYLKELLGTDTDLDALLRGHIVKLPTSWPGFPLQLVRQDKAMFTQGYTQTGSVISTVMAGSRAEAAGLKAGDQVARASSIWNCIGDDSIQLELVVERAGQKLDIKFLPRSYELVPCWQWVEED